ncbi:MAG: hypothetical protein HQM15_11820 [Deltaproteobacteria bacterium]|nr:hypothetical protein [Deltaproteobacteria bacterium]
MTSINRYTREHNERVHSNAVAQIVSRTQVNEQLSSSPSKRLSPLAGVEQCVPQKLQGLMGNTFRNLDYQGLLQSKDLDLIQKNYPAYKQAEQKTDVNWRVLAAIHLRETNLSQAAGTKHNPFQFDGIYKSKISGNLLQDAITAGNILQTKTQVENAHYGLKAVDPLRAEQMDGENLRQAIFRYNGPIYGSPEKSPYVMNAWDEEHQAMPIYRGKAAVPHWGVDHRLGVMTTIRELNRAFPGIPP